MITVDQRVGATVTEEQDAETNDPHKKSQHTKRIRKKISYFFGYKLFIPSTSQTIHQHAKFQVLVPPYLFRLLPFHSHGNSRIHPNAHSHNTTTPLPLPPLASILLNHRCPSESIHIAFAAVIFLSHLFLPPIHLTSLRHSHQGKATNTASAITTTAVSLILSPPSSESASEPSHFPFSSFLLHPPTRPQIHPHESTPPPPPPSSLPRHRQSPPQSLPPSGLCFTSSPSIPAAWPPSRRLLASLQKHLATLPPNIS